MFVLEIDDLDPREERKYVYGYTSLVLEYGKELEYAEVFTEPDDLSTVPWPPTVKEAVVIEQTFASQRPKRVLVVYCSQCARIRLPLPNHTHVCRSSIHDGK